MDDPTTVALVLGSGGVRGDAHVGSIQVASIPRRAGLVGPAAEPAPGPAQEARVAGKPGARTDLGTAGADGAPHDRGQAAD